MSVMKKYNLPQSGVVLAVILGVFVFLLSLAGCYGTLKKNKKLLFLYVLIVLILVIIEFVGGALVLKYVGYINDIPANLNSRSFSVITEYLFLVL